MEKRDREIEEEIVKYLNEYEKSIKDEDYVIKEEVVVKMIRIKKAIQKMFGDDIIEIKTEITKIALDGCEVYFKIPGLSLVKDIGIGYKMGDFYSDILKDASSICIGATNDGNLGITVVIKGVYEKIKKEN